MKLPHCLLSSLIVLVAACCGCDGQIYSDNIISGSAISIPAKSRWRATGDLVDISNAADGNVNTFALSRESYENAKLTIDLGKPCVFNTIVLDHGSANQFGFCRRQAVQISYDGRNYTQVYTGPGTRRITYLNLVTPTLARFVRIVALVPGDRPWSVAEVYFQ
jgi:hypothetical protein